MKPFKKNLIISIALFAMSLPLISFADDEIGTVFITGANRGIGLEFTKQYLEKGWTVIATARKPDKAEDLNQLQNQYPEHLSIQQLDVTDHDRIDALAKELEGQPIDLLLNNAGISGYIPDQIFGRLDYESFDQVLAVNTVAPLKLAEAFYPHVKSSNLKKIVSVSSSEGSIGGAYDDESGRMYFYRSSKSALNMVMVNLAFQLKSRGIAVGLVNPGPTDTDFMRGIPFPLRSTEEAVENMIDNIEDITLDNTAAYLNYNGKTIDW
jgi:NAD(P)-dependent dehydrogenase (short-subunit alcohol dehydrogenase family)